MASSLLLAGCGEGTPPSAYRHARDRLLAAVPLAFLDDDFAPCFRRGQGRPRRLPDRECYRFAGPRRMRGVAVTGFETSGFYPQRTRMPRRGERSRVWMDMEPRLLPPSESRECAQGCAVYLDFVGRRTAVAGRYGHMGSADRIVVVDRVLEARLLE